MKNFYYEHKLILEFPSFVPMNAQWSWEDFSYQQVSWSNNYNMHASRRHVCNAWANGYFYASYGWWLMIIPFLSSLIMFLFIMKLEKIIIVNFLKMWTLCHFFPKHLRKIEASIYYGMIIQSSKHILTIRRWKSFISKIYLPFLHFLIMGNTT